MLTRNMKAQILKYFLITIVFKNLQKLFQYFKQKHIEIELIYQMRTSFTRLVLKNSGKILNFPSKL